MIAALQLPFRTQSLHRSFFTSFPLYFFPCHPRLRGLCRGAFVSLESSASSTPSDSPFTTCLPRAPRGHSPLTPLKSAHPKNAPITPLQSALTKKAGGRRAPSLLSVLYSRPPITSSHLCLCLLFLLSSPPQGENTHVCK